MRQKHSPSFKKQISFYRKIQGLCILRGCQAFLPWHYSDLREVTGQHRLANTHCYCTHLTCRAGIVFWNNANTEIRIVLRGIHLSLFLKKQ